VLNEESNRILGVSTAQWPQIDLQAQLQATRLDAEGADRCCFGIEQSIFAAPHTPRIRLLSMERTLFILEWLRDPSLRRRVNDGLNKGEARNALARAVLFYRLGELRDRSFENQRYRASGLNLVVAAKSAVPTA
jgi:hypothetical protein